jgi:hypothetical protein
MKLVDRLRTAAKCLPPTLAQDRPYEVPQLKDEAAVRMPEPGMNYENPHCVRPKYYRQNKK